MRRKSLILLATVALLSILSPEAAPAATAGADTGWNVPVWRVIGALVVCLLLAGAAGLILRSRVSGIVQIAAKGRRLRLIESLRLSHQTDICLIAIDGHELVIAATPRGAILLLDCREHPN